MPVMTANEELQLLYARKEELTEKVNYYGRTLDYLHRMKAKIDHIFVDAFMRREKVQHRIIYLERKVKYLKPAVARAPKKEQSVEDMLAKLKPSELEALRAILEKRKVV